MFLFPRMPFSILVKVLLSYSFCLSCPLKFFTHFGLFARDGDVIPQWKEAEERSEAAYFTVIQKSMG